MTRREKHLAKAVAKRGVPGIAVIDAMRETGATREDGVVKEYEFVLRLSLDGGELRVSTTQFMNRYTLHGLAVGEQTRVLYDRDDPATLLVRGSPKYRIIESGGELAVVPVENVRSASD